MLKTIPETLAFNSDYIHFCNGNIVGLFAAVAPLWICRKRLRHHLLVIYWLFIHLVICKMNNKQWCRRGRHVYFHTNIFNKTLDMSRGQGCLEMANSNCTACDLKCDSLSAAPTKDIESCRWICVLPALTCLNALLECLSLLHELRLNPYSLY